MHNEPTENLVLSISKDELSQMMEKAVQRGLADAGLYLEDSDDRKEAREDFRFLRRWRRAADGAASKIGYAVITILTGGLLIALWVGIKVHVLKQ
jgi:hypothetical protein